MIKHSDAVGICLRLSSAGKVGQVKQPVFKGKRGEVKINGDTGKVFNEDGSHVSHKDDLVVNGVLTPPQSGEHISRGKMGLRLSAILVKV